MELFAILEKFELVEKITLLAQKHQFGFQCQTPEAVIAKLKTYKFAVDLRETKVAGRCFYGRRIEINYKLMSKDKVKNFKDTLIHETAHAVANFIFHDRGHGRAFKYVDRFLGGSGKRCHDMDFLVGKVNWRYICECCGKVYTSTRLLSRIQYRSCRKCGKVKGHLRVEKRVGVHPDGSVAYSRISNPALLYAPIFK